MSPARTGRPGRRRLTARSAIASTLLGVSPPELPARSLVATAELLGIAPGTARVAISRMVAAGELAATGSGYRLVGPVLLARQARQDLSRRGEVGPWDGTWRTAVVTADAAPAATRTERRAALVALRLAELREGVWMRPDNLPVGSLPAPEALVAEHCLALSSTVEDPEALAGRLWDLPGWDRGARQLVVDLDRCAVELADPRPGTLGEGFVTAAAALRHLQADPLLPAELLPARWAGPELRRTYDDYDTAFKATLRAWLRAQVPAVP